MIDEEKAVVATWYDHNCDYISKYCEAYHTRLAIIPEHILKEYAR